MNDVERVRGSAYAVVLFSPYENRGGWVGGGS